jgi:photosystem II stability/assembly factor-like uncharacterized protein
LRWKILAALAAALSLGGVIQAQKWERRGPEGGMVVSLGAATTGQLYLGAADGHVFASKDHAETWELRGRVGQRLDAVVTRLVVDPRDENRLFASVWYQHADGGGVFESVDGGRDWRLLGLGKEAVRALEIAPSDPNELVAGARTGVFLSTDNGKTWSRISPEGDPELKNLDSVAIDPRDPQVIYAGTYHLPWLTHDGGKTWKPIIAGIIDDSDIMSLRLDASNPDRVYMSACSGIYRSDNQGGQWTKLQGIPYAARRTQVIVQDPGTPKTLYAGTTTGLWVTRDGGENWTLTTSKDWVVNALVVLSGKNGGPQRVVLGTERGIETSDDAGVTFAEANRGFTHSVVKRLVVDQRNPSRLLMVAERSGAELRESADHGKIWSPVSLEATQRGKATALKADEIENVFTSAWGWMVRLQNGQFWLLADGTKTWREWSLVLPESVKRNTSTANRLAKSESTRTLKAGTTIGFSQHGAVVSTNEGLMQCDLSGRCARMKAFETKGPVRTVSVDTTGEKIAVVMEGKFGLSADGGKTAVWRDLPVPMENIVWVDVADGGTNPPIYLGSSHGLFLSKDAGASWQQFGTGLPIGPVEQWLRGPDVWAVSEEGGDFYVSRDRGLSWQRADSNAERSTFSGLAALPDGGVLAGSESEGLLRFEWK